MGAAGAIHTLECDGLVASPASVSAAQHTRPVVSSASLSGAALPNEAAEPVEELLEVMVGTRSGAALLAQSCMHEYAKGSGAHVRGCTARGGLHGVDRVEGCLGCFATCPLVSAPRGGPWCPCVDDTIGIVRQDALDDRTPAALHRVA